MRSQMNELASFRGEALQAFEDTDTTEAFLRRVECTRARCAGP